MKKAFEYPVITSSELTLDFDIMESRNLVEPSDKVLLKLTDNRTLSSEYKIWKGKKTE